MITSLYLSNLFYLPKMQVQMYILVKLGSVMNA